LNQQEGGGMRSCVVNARSWQPDKTAWKQRHQPKEEEANRSTRTTFDSRGRGSRINCETREGRSRYV